MTPSSFARPIAVLSLGLALLVDATLSLGVGMLAAPARAAAPAASTTCTAAGWDVRHEHALFGGQPHSVRAGTDAAAAPVIQPDHLYALQLTPQPRVHFAQAPGKVMLNDGAYGGLVRFEVDRPGSYRVSLDIPFWIDVVAGNQELPTQDFTGLHDCDTPRKIVEFVLPAGRPLLLQFSGEARPRVRVAVTRAPARAP